MLNGKFRITVDNIDFILGHGTLYSSDAKDVPPLFMSNSDRIEELQKFKSEYVYSPTDVLFGIVAPSCNLKCPNCIKQLSDNYKNVKKTTPEALRGVLETASKLGIRLNISFANNEIFTPNLKKYQEELISVLKDFDINFYVVHTNGLYADDTYPLVKFLLEHGKYEFVVGANLTKTDSIEHLDISRAKSHLTRMLSSGIKNISINALYDLDEEIDRKAFRDFLNFASQNNIKIKPSVVFKQTPPPKDNKFTSLFLDEFPLYCRTVQSKEPFLYALYKGEIPVAPVDGFSSFFICDSNTIALMSVDKTYTFGNVEELSEAISQAFTEQYMTNDTEEECASCSLLHGCFQANRHKRLCEYERINSELLLAIRCKEAAICNRFLGQSSIGILNQIINTSYVTEMFWKQFRRK